MKGKLTILQIFSLTFSGIMLAFIISLFVMFGPPPSKEPKLSRMCTDEGMAFIMSQRFVKRELRSPDSAKFPYAHNDGVAIMQTDQCKFSVHGYVDAQNAFGAMVRTRYSIDMEYLPEDKVWRGTNLKM